STPPGRPRARDFQSSRPQPQESRSRGLLPIPLSEVAVAAVREDHHDPTAPDAFRKAQCGVQRGAARSPDEKTFVAGETPNRGLGVLRCDREDLVSEIRIPDSGHVGRGKVFDALDPVEGAVWLDAD